MARGGADDVFAVGPPEVVIPAVQRFAVDIAARCNLQLQWSKSMVYCRQGDLPGYCPPGLTMAGEQVGDEFLRGVEVYGVPIGSDGYILYKLRQKKEEIIRDAEKARELLASDPQALWSCLRLSMSSL